MENYSAKDKAYLAALMFLKFVMVGAGIAALGPTLGYYAKVTNNGLAEANNLFLIKPIGFMVGSLVCHHLMRLLNLKLLVFLLITSWAVFFYLPLLTTSLYWIGFFLFLLGLCEGVIEVFGNYFIIRLYPRNNRIQMISLHFCFGIGAILAPYLIGFDLDVNENPRIAYLILCGVTIPAFGLLFFKLNKLPSKLEETAQDENKQNIPLFSGILIGLIFILYVGVEIAYSNWIFQYSVDQLNFSLYDAGMMTSAFWVTFTLFRLVGICFRNVKTATLLKIHFNLIIILAIPPILFGHPVLNVFSALGLGFAMSLIFPSMISYLEEQFHLNPAIIGKIIMSGTIGAFAIPWLFGYFYVRFSPQWLYYLVAIFSVFLSATFILFSRQAPKRQPK